MARVRGTITQEILSKISSLGNFSLALRRTGLGAWPEVCRQLEILEAQERVVKDAFYYLKKKGLIEGEVVNDQLYIRLTPEGQEQAGKYQINQLRIRPQKEWDGKWRLVIFDIPENRRIKREAFRGKLKELGFYRLQRSCWVHAYPCEREIKLLREFFNLTPGHLRFFEVERLEEDRFLREFFDLNKDAL